jgi:hypothetical protein
MVGGGAATLGRASRAPRGGAGANTPSSRVRAGWGNTDASGSSSAGGGWAGKGHAVEAAARPGVTRCQGRAPGDVPLERGARRARERARGARGHGVAGLSSAGIGAAERGEGGGGRGRRGAGQSTFGSLLARRRPRRAVEKMGAAPPVHAGRRGGRAPRGGKSQARTQARRRAARRGRVQGRGTWGGAARGRGLAPDNNAARRRAAGAGPGVTGSKRR